MTRFLKITALLLASVSLAAAQTVELENGTNLTVDSTWNLPGTNLVIGGTSPSNTLSITGSGSVTNADSFVGTAVGATDNSVNVAGDWTMTGTLNIGAGTNSAVNVNSGGTVSAADLNISSDVSSFNLNTGGTFRIDNDLDVSGDGFNWGEGGHLIVHSNLTGMATSTNNEVYLNGNRELTLDGGFLATEANDFVVGLGSTGDLTVTNGAWVVVGGIATNGFAPGIVVASTSATAEMLVDEGSKVMTDGILQVGDGASGLGQVTVSNNSSITVADLDVGTGSEFNLDDGGALIVTGDFDAEAEAELNWNSGGRLEVQGKLTLDDGLDEEGQSLTLNGTDANWTIDGAIASHANGTVAIQGGAAVTNTGAGSVTGSNNTITVQGTDSHWLNNGTLSISGTDNSVTAQSGGRVTADDLIVADGNEFNLNSGGTLEITGTFDWVGNSNELNWTSGGELAVVGGALTGMEEVEIIANGATKTAEILSGGRDLSLSSSSWSAGTDDLIVGFNESYSELLATNGTTISSADGYIGWGSGSANNRVLVSGTGSEWANSGDLYVGAYWEDGTNLTKAGSGNALVVENGGQVFVGDQTMANAGMLVAADGGVDLTVWGGSVTVEDTLYVGVDSSITGKVSIMDGGTVSVGDLELDGSSILDLQDGGTFAIGDGFDVETTGFNWGEGGHLSVGGDLSNMTTTNIGSMYGLLDGGRDLTLDNGTWNSTAALIVGATANGSQLIVKNTGTLTSATAYIGYTTNANNNLVEISSGSSWVINSGDLWVGYAGSSNTLNVTSKETVDIDGDVFLGNTNTVINTISVSGSNSLLAITGKLDIGSSAGGSNNVLKVSDNADVTVGTDLSLYSGNTISLASDGAIQVTGDVNVYSNSTISGAGTIELTQSDAVLTLFGGNAGIDSGILFQGAGSNTNAVEGGTFYVFGSNSHQYADFAALEMSDATLAGYGEVESSVFGTVNMTGGTIAPFGVDTNGVITETGTLEISGDFTGSDTVYSAQVNGDDFDQLIFSAAGGVSLTGLIADVHVTASPSNQTATILSATVGDFGDSSFASNHVTDALLLFDARLESVGSTNINVVIEPNNEVFSSALSLAVGESVRAGFNGMKGAVFTRTKQLRRNLVSTAHSMPHEAFLMAQTNAPAGAKGPGDQNTIFDMHIWVQHYNGQGTYSPSGDSHGFDLNNHGTTIGFDRLVGEDLTVGFNYTHARSAAHTTNTDQLDSETYWLGAYGEWVGKSGIYVDALAGYGRSNYDSTRVETTNYTGTASFRGNNLGAYVDAGQYYYYKNLSVSPFLGLHALYAKTEEHGEDNGYGEITHVDDETRKWLETALGLKARYRFDTGIGRFQITGYAEWLHDLIQDDVQTVMSADGIDGNIGMAKISPDADTVNTGVGVSLITTDYLEIGVGYNGRFSENSEEHTGSIMLDIMF